MWDEPRQCLFGSLLSLWNGTELFGPPEYLRTVRALETDGATHAGHGIDD